MKMFETNMYVLVLLEVTENTNFSIQNQNLWFHLSSETQTSAMCPISSTNWQETWGPYFFFLMNFEMPVTRTV